jgi:hypothetical protein
MVVTTTMIPKVDREEQDEVLSEALVQKTIEQKMDLPLEERGYVKNHSSFLLKKAHFQYNPNSHLLEEVVHLVPFLVSLSLFCIFFLK